MKFCRMSNVAKNIYFEPEFNNLCGFTQNEVEEVKAILLDHVVLKKKRVKLKRLPG